ncbi:MAG: NHLP leader peptide family RiPP precursor [Verrucomicrobia bacterium]|nr:NHLP leader peptide family RiPP precursor [Verrucomicrobiota bacterium]MBV8274942.1 NHLP leader peptide family RiPP precursor [Verrucomicrobiota bacterium]
MDPNSNISRKDIKEALVRAALKDEAFRESLLANAKFAVERALGTTLPDRLKVVLLQETDDLMYIVLPKDFPDDTADLSDAELETIAGGFLSAETNPLSGQDPTL